MALYHKATITPTKAELVATWVRSQPWCPDVDEPIESIGAFRFDDPDGKVGLETHLVSIGDVVVQVPFTYREAPFADHEHAFVAQIEHSALGTRWVYDGLGDERYVIMLAAVAMTGQGEALGMVEYDGQWHIAPTNVRITGGGWPQERALVDGLHTADVTATNVEFGNDTFNLTAYRHPAPGPQPAIGLTATWPGLAEPVVLAEIVAR